MSEGHQSARRILDGLTEREAEHPADPDQGRALDPASHRRGLFSPIVDACMYCVIRMAEALMSDDEAQPAKPLKNKALPNLEQKEASSWSVGYWTGLLIGAVIGIGLATLLFTSGVLS